MVNNHSRFNKVVTLRYLGVTTIFLIFLLILAGGIVRGTGSGMGCPDWPKCFGQWIPPTQASELPENYKDMYAQKRKAKNTRLAKYFTFLGMDELSKQLLHDESMYEEADFNALKTWIEYINRLLGALSGFFILLIFFTSLAFVKTRPIIPVLSFLILVVVGFQGWLGSLVVSTKLLPGMVSLHMLLALLIVFLLLVLVVNYTDLTIDISANHYPRFLKTWLLIAIGLFLVQVVLGTQVRESVDLVSKSLGETQRGNWIEKLNTIFFVHRSYSWLVLLVHSVILYQLFWFSKRENNPIYLNAWILVILTMAEMLLGAGMVYFAIPPTIQIFHLFIAFLICGTQFYTWLLLQKNNSPSKSLRSQEPKPTFHGHL